MAPGIIGTRVSLPLWLALEVDLALDTAVVLPCLAMHSTGSTQVANRQLLENKTCHYVGGYVLRVSWHLAPS